MRKGKVRLAEMPRNNRNNRNQTTLGFAIDYTHGCYTDENDFNADARHWGSFGYHYKLRFWACAVCCFAWFVC